MHDRCGTGERTDGDVDGAFGFKATDELVVVDDGRDIGIIDRLGEFRRVVGIDDHNRRFGGYAVDDFRLIKTPFFKDKGRLGVRLTEQNRLGIGAFDFVQIPSPDQGRAGGIGVGRFMAENEGGHER